MAPNFRLISTTVYQTLVALDLSAFPEESPHYDWSSTSGNSATASLDCMAEYVQVSTATETREQAVELARGATATRLVAGAQIVGPVTSVFWHQGEFGQGEEWQIVFKTTQDRYLELEAHLSKNHPWNNPEIVAVPILVGSRGYLEWVSRTTARHDQAD